MQRILTEHNFTKHWSVQEIAVIYMAPKYKVYHIALNKCKWISKIIDSEVYNLPSLSLVSLLFGSSKFLICL